MKWRRLARFACRLSGNISVLWGFRSVISRRMQYSVLTLFCVTTIVCAVCGVISHRIREFTTERAVAICMSRSGAVLTHEDDVLLKWIICGVPRRVVGIQYPEHATDHDLVHISKLARLRWVVLEDTDVSDEGMKYLGAHGRLVTVDVTDTAVTDAGISALGESRKLETLVIPGTKVTLVSVLHSRCRATLRSITFEPRQLGETSLSQVINDMPRLETIGLCGEAVTDAFLESCPSPLRIRGLVLWNTNVTLAAIDRFRDRNSGVCVITMGVTGAKRW